MAIYPKPDVDPFAPMGYTAPQEIPQEAPPEAPPEAPMAAPPEAPVEEPETPEFEAILKAVEEALSVPDKLKRYDIFQKATKLNLAKVPDIQTLTLGQTRIRA